MKNPGHAFQFFFSYDRDSIKDEIRNILTPAINTAKRLQLKLDDLFNERVNYLSDYCGYEKLYLVLWTRPTMLSSEQQKRAMKEKYPEK